VAVKIAVALVLPVIAMQHATIADVLLAIAAANENIFFLLNKCTNTLFTSYSL
jgi:hypothetical protein